MGLSQRLIQGVKDFEGFRARAYQDPIGIWTIGFGRTGGIREGQTTTREYETLWLHAKLKEFSQGVHALVTVPMSEKQHDALVSFSYNLGLGALRRSILLRKFNAGDAEGAAKEFSKWVHAGGKRLRGLVLRREKEQSWFRAGMDHAPRN